MLSSDDNSQSRRVLSNQLAELISAHGYWIVAIVVALESMGLPAPGETALVTAAIFAGTTQRLNIAWIIVAAAIGAIVGDNLGYLIGRRFGYSMLLRYGHLVRVDAKRIKLGQYLFARHGGKVVFFGRFIAVLRAIAAVLAGTNCMPCGGSSYSMRREACSGLRHMEWQEICSGNGSGARTARWPSSDLRSQERLASPLSGGCVDTKRLLLQAEQALPGPLPPAGFARF